MKMCGILKNSMNTNKSKSDDVRKDMLDRPGMGGNCCRHDPKYNLQKAAETTTAHDTKRMGPLTRKRENLLDLL